SGSADFQPIERRCGMRRIYRLSSCVPTPLLEVRMKRVLLLSAALLAVATTAPAQVRSTKILTLDGAKNIVNAAEAEAKKNKWNMAIAIVDAAGGLVLFHKGDGARPSNVDFALAKARTAARYQRETRVLDSLVAAGQLKWLGTDAFPLEGGVNIIVDGQTIGAVG